MDCPARPDQVVNIATRRALGMEPDHAIRCYLHGSLGWMIDRADGELEFFVRVMLTSNQNEANHG